MMSMPGTRKKSCLLSNAQLGEHFRPTLLLLNRLLPQVSLLSCHVRKKTISIRCVESVVRAVRCQQSAGFGVVGVLLSSVAESVFLNGIAVYQMATFSSSAWLDVVLQIAVAKTTFAHAC